MTDITETEDVQVIAVKSHSAVSKTVTKCLTILRPKSDDTPAKRTVVELAADAKVAGKAITISEIVKRRIKAKGGVMHQSTRVQEKPISADSEEVVADNVERKHLQEERFEKPKRKVEAQIIIRMDNLSGLKE